MPKRSNITLEDHTALKRLLLSKPRTALRFFRRAHVAFLMDVACFREIAVEQPERAALIVVEAATFDIPLNGR